MFHPKVRLAIIAGCVAYGLYQLYEGKQEGAWLLLAAAILSIGHFRSADG